MLDPMRQRIQLVNVLARGKYVSTGQAVQFFSIVSLKPAKYPALQTAEEILHIYIDLLEARAITNYSFFM